MSQENNFPIHVEILINDTIIFTQAGGVKSII